MARTIEGVVGQIQWAYYMAAAIDGYLVSWHAGPPAHWRLAGRIVAADAFKLAQRPLVFRAPHERGAWVWSIEAMTIVDGRVRARLGPMWKEGPDGTRAVCATGGGAARPQP